MRLNPPFASLLLSSSLVAFVGIAHAATYNYQTLQYPGAEATAAVAINSVGTIAGAFRDSSFNSHGFIYENGVYTAVDVAACSQTILTGINDSAVLSGVCEAANGSATSFLLDREGALTSIGVGNAIATYVEGINNRSSGAGWYQTPGITFGSFAFGNREVVFIPQAPNGTATEAFGINNDDVVVGQALVRKGTLLLGFVLEGDSFSHVEYPSALGTSLRGINDRGQIVGVAYPSLKGPNTAFVWEKGSFTALAVPGSAQATASGINNSGVIVGNYATQLGSIKTLGFVATPQ